MFNNEQNNQNKQIEKIDEIPKKIIGKKTREINYLRVIMAIIVNYGVQMLNQLLKMKKSKKIKKKKIILI